MLCRNWGSGKSERTSATHKDSAEVNEILTCNIHSSLSNDTFHIFIPIRGSAQMRTYVNKIDSAIEQKPTASPL